MFLLLGGALSFIVGLVGVLNFFNAILTGILARKRELAVLQSIGMTGKQLKTMLVYEGLFYALGGGGHLSGADPGAGPGGLHSGGETLFWFFTYRLTLVPFLVVIPDIRPSGHPGPPGGVPVGGPGTPSWSVCGRRET